MPRHKTYVPHGVIPAVLLPFDCRSRHRRDKLPQAPARRGCHGWHHGPDHQRPLHRGRFLHLRRAAPGSCHHAGRDRRPPADRQWRVGRRQPGGRAHRPHGGRWRRLRPAGVPASTVHARSVAADGDRAFQAHRGCHRPADHRLPVSAQHRPGVSEGHAAEAHRRGAVHPRHQGLDRQRPASRMARAHAAEPAAACERALDAQRLAVLLPRARLQWLALGQRQRHPRPAVAAVPGGAAQRPRRGARL